MSNEDKLILYEEERNLKMGILGLIICVLIGLLLSSFLLFVKSLDQSIHGGISPFDDLILFAKSTEKPFLILPFGLLFTLVFFGIFLLYGELQHKIIYIDQNLTKLFKERSNYPNFNLQLIEIKHWYFVNEKASSLLFVKMQNEKTIVIEDGFTAIKVVSIIQSKTDIKIEEISQEEMKKVWN